MTITIGVDVSKYFLDCFDSLHNKHKRFANTDQGVQELLAWYKDYDSSSCHLILESTGVYQRRIQYAAVHDGMVVYVVNPLRVRQFARSTGQLAKNDTLDAKILCTFGQKMDLHALFPRSPNELKLADLLRLRQHLVALKQNHSNHLETHDDTSIIAFTTPLLTTIQQQIKSCEQQIRSLIKQDPLLTKKQKLLSSVPGVGDVVCWHLLAFLPELGHASRGQIASLSGVAPMVCESGMSKGRTSIQGGRQAIRNVLYMGILSTIRWSKTFANYYETLKTRRGSAKVALVACMRRLLIRLNCMMKNQQAWNCP